VGGNTSDHFAVERFVPIEQKRNPIGFGLHAAPPRRSNSFIVVSL
jgi:hypothetical protein